MPGWRARSGQRPAAPARSPSTPGRSGRGACLAKCAWPCCLARRVLVLVLTLRARQLGFVLGVFAVGLGSGRRCALRRCRPASRTAPMAEAAACDAEARQQSRTQQVKVDVRILDPRMHGPAAGLCHARQRRPRPARLPRRAATLAPNAWQLVRHRHRHPPGRPGLCGADPAALGPGPQARHRAGQPGGPDRQRLPGRAQGQRLEPQRHAPSRCSRWSGWPSW